MLKFEGKGQDVRVIPIRVADANYKFGTLKIWYIRKIIPRYIKE